MPNNHGTIAIADAISKLEHYCAYQERCLAEVVKKLKALHVDPAYREAVIKHLRKENYIDEARFARAFATGKFNLRQWGRKRIFSELRSRNISETDINTALGEIDDTLYLKIFNDLVQKRWKQTGGDNPESRKKKLADYLLYRGWETELVYGAISEMDP